MGKYGDLVQIWYNIGTTAQRLFQTVSTLTRYPVTINIHGDGNRAVTQLLLNIARTLMGHEKQCRIRVPQIMGVSFPKTGCLTNSFDKGLHFSLTKRPKAFFLGIRKQEIHAGTPTRFEAFLCKVYPVVLKLIHQKGGKIHTKI